MKKYKPTTPSRRNMSTVSYRDSLTVSKPQKSLTKGFKRSVGRNNQGRVTAQHRGSGHKRLWREVDFKFDKKDIPFTLKTIEYDPNRSGFIGLAVYRDGEKRYILVSKAAKVGATYVVSADAPIEAGNRMPIARIPIGTFVYNVEIKVDGGAKIARSAGNYVEIIAKDAGYADLKMPSSEVRKVPQEAWATIGEVSNEESRLVNFGKAGRSRWKGIRPKVRGTAMNPVDHPHGGGEGRQGRGRRRAVTATGKPTGKGQKTRRPKKYSNRLIVARRRVGKRRK